MVLFALIAVQIVFLSPFLGDMAFVSASLTPSPDEVGVSLTHEHNTDTCYSTVWVACGGTWTSTFPSAGVTQMYFCTNRNSTRIVNGIQLSNIHSEYVSTPHSGTHSGEYAKKRTCTLEDLGTFKIKKKVEGSNVYLVAYIEHKADTISEYSITWDQAGAVWDGSQSTLELEHNGTYTATLDWYDRKAEVWYQETLEYNQTVLHT